MKQEDKELLLQDLCARLPYDAHVNYEGEIYSVLGISYGRLVLCKPFMSRTLEYCPLVEEVKLCLFPLSSMTEEQKQELDGRFELDLSIAKKCIRNETPNIVSSLNRMNYLNANHFDYRGLIPKSLAIDCTNLNIY